MNKFYIVFFILILYSCSTDNNTEEIIFDSVNAKIIGSVSCNADTYEVEIDNNGSSLLVGVINLPEEFKKENLLIHLDLLKYNNDELVCVTLRPNGFYLPKNIVLR